MSRLASLLLIATLLAPAHRPAAAQDPAREREVDSLFAPFAQGVTPGAAIAVVRDGRVLLSKGYGLASLEHRTPITPSTVFDVASMSKQFAGLAVAMLVDQGRVKLTDDIRKYIPELADVGHTITVDHLLHHTSGLRDWPGMLRLAGWQQSDVISFDQILTFAYNQRTLNFVPGAEYTYSNTGYNLLAELVARVTGQSFRAWTDEHFFRPLGMGDSHFHDDHYEVVPNRAFGYARNGSGGFVTITDNLTALGSSSLFTTVNDLARWAANFDDPRVAGPAALALSRTRGVLNDGTTIPYAFGIVHGEYRGRPTLSHGGSWAGFATHIVHFPERRFAVIVLANSPIVFSTRLSYAIADVFLGPELGPATASSNPLAAAPTVEVAAATADRYTGLYRLGPGRYARIRRDGASLKARISPGGDTDLQARSDTSFWVPALNAPVAFATRGGAVELGFDGQWLSQLEEPKPLAPADLARFAGEYYSADLDASYRVESNDTALVMRHRRHGAIPLTRLWGDEFMGTVGLRSLEFQRDAAGQVVGFTVYIDQRSRDVRFVKRD